MFKVMIVSNLDGKIIGEGILTEDFNNINEAVEAAKVYSSVWTQPMYEIREYNDENDANIISFDKMDTGKICCRNQSDHKTKGDDTIEMEMNIEKFCGINLFTWKEWDMMDGGGFYFYDVSFCIESMKKYDGYDVLRQMDGTMVIYAEEGEKVVWTGFVTDVSEVAAKLSGREDGNVPKEGRISLKC